MDRKAIVPLAILAVLMVGCGPKLTPTPTDTSVPSLTPTAMLTSTATAMPAATTAMPTDTPTPMPTGTPTAMPTATLAPTITPTDTPVATVTPTDTPTAVPTVAPTDTPTAIPIDTDTPEPVRYGVYFPYPSNIWSESDRPAVRERLEYLRSLGVEVVVQDFSSELVDSGRERDWLIFLDEAQRLDIEVVAWLWPSHHWDGGQFNLYYAQRFLEVTKDHPALLAYYGFHEPLPKFSDDQLRHFYRQVKSLAPKVLIYHDMSDIAWFEGRPEYGNHHFSEGICDICAIWYYPFGWAGGEPIFERQRVLDTVTANDALVRSKAPHSRLWFLGQAYEFTRMGYKLRMPTAEEMCDLGRMLLQEPRIDGFLWYPYEHDLYDKVLGDPEMAEQRQAVKDVYERWLR